MHHQARVHFENFTEAKLLTGTVPANPGRMVGLINGPFHF